MKHHKLEFLFVIIGSLLLSMAFWSKEEKLPPQVSCPVGPVTVRQTETKYVTKTVYVDKVVYVDRPVITPGETIYVTLPPQSPKKEGWAVSSNNTGEKLFDIEPEKNWEVWMGYGMQNTFDKGSHNTPALSIEGDLLKIQDFNLGIRGSMAGDSIFVGVGLGLKL